MSARSSDQALAELERKVNWLESRMEPPLAGEFTGTASSPADDLYVVTPDWDGRGNTFGPVRWSPIGNALPAEGDEAVIVERSDGVWQVVAWWSGSQETGAAQSAIDALTDGIAALDTRLDVVEANRKRGQVTVTWPGGSAFSNAYTVTHNLGSVPASAGAICGQLSNGSGHTAFAAVEAGSLTSTQIQFRATAFNHVPTVGVTCTLYWSVDA